jgi:hypothetical protein
VSALVTVFERHRADIVAALHPTTVIGHPPARRPAR